MNIFQQLKQKALENIIFSGIILEKLKRTLAAIEKRKATYRVQANEQHELRTKLLASIKYL